MREQAEHRTGLETWDTADLEICATHESEFGGNFFDAVALDAVAGLKFVEAVDANAAFHAGANFVDFVLEAAERLDDAFVNEIFAAHDADFATRDAAMRDNA